ncbi:MAG: aldo/keto reductase [Actinomycetales bacterium]|nr:aldo/keto reductase [Actinomycetales bacterium]
MTTTANTLPDGWNRPVGSTGLTITAVTVGGSPLGHVEPAHEGVATARAALESEIRALDTSNGYSDGESERRIGRALEELGGKPEDFLVVTKVDPRGSDYSGARVLDSIAESRERLGLDELPLVHLHDPEYHDFDEITAPGGAVDTLVRLREEGKVRAVGLAGGDSRVMARYLELGVFDVLLTHSRWSLLDRSAGDIISGALDRGMAVFNAAVYGAGILADPSITSYGYRPAKPELVEAAAAMRAVCERYGTDLRTAALQFSTRDARFASTIVGMSHPERVAATVASASAVLPEELWPELEALVPPRGVWLDS